MTRRQILHAAALSVTLLVTVPGLALLCRGHAPSRFATANLPFWERVLPRPVSWRIPLRGIPMPPGAVQFSTPALSAQLENVAPDALFSTLEHPSASHPSPQGAGRAGVWLQAACTLGRSDGHLSQTQDQIAARLMNAQDPDGYLAAGTKKGRWSAAEVTAYRDNLLGLLEYYALTRSPAAIYAAMQAGDLITTTFPTATDSPAGDDLILPMVQLSHWSGEAKYRYWAKQQADDGSLDGPGLCALYRETSQTSYLRDAQKLQQAEQAAGQTDPALAAALWNITGNPVYIPAFRSAAAPWVSPLGPGTEAYGHIPDGLAVNVSANSRVTLGLVHLTQRLSTPKGKPRLATFTVDTPHPMLLTLKLPMLLTLKLPAPPTSKPNQMVGYNLNGKPQRGIPSGHWLVLTRRWKPGDQVSLAAPATD